MATTISDGRRLRPRHERRHDVRGDATTLPAIAAAAAIVRGAGRASNPPPDRLFTVMGRLLGLILVLVVTGFTLVDVRFVRHATNALLGASRADGVSEQSGRWVTGVAVVDSPSRNDSGRPLRPIPPPTPRHVTLLVGNQGGGLGNHLNSLAHALRIKEWVEARYPHLTINLRAEHRKHLPWTAQVVLVLRQCFPVIRDHMELIRIGTWTGHATIFPFTAGAIPSGRAAMDDNDVVRQQEQWLQLRGYSRLMTLHMDRCPRVKENARSVLDTSCWDDTLQVVLQMHREQDEKNGHAHPKTNNQTWERQPSESTDSSDGESPPPHVPSLSLPFLRTETWSYNTPFTKPSYYHLIRQWFVMNETDVACCPPAAQLPGSDEIVWHYRNFHAENPRLTSYGFDDVTTSQAVAHLFQPLMAVNQSSSSHSLPQQPLPVAMVSRRPEDLLPYAEALSRVSPLFVTRLVWHGTSASDFCFLRATQRLLLGLHTSSYVGWAAILGHSPVVLYAVNSTHARRRARDLNQSWSDRLVRGDWVRAFPRRFRSLVIPDAPQERRHHRHYQPWPDVEVESVPYRPGHTD